MTCRRRIIFLEVVELGNLILSCASPASVFFLMPKALHLSRKTSVNDASSELKFALVMRRKEAAIVFLQ